MGRVVEGQVDMSDVRIRVGAIIAYIKTQLHTVGTCLCRLPIYLSH